jgi:hypothetical protein
VSEAKDNIENAERIGHAEHESGGHNPISRYIGVTIALLGITLTVCSAKVGKSRTDFIGAMVSKEDAHLKYQAQAIKYRQAVSQLQALRAMVTTPAGALPRKEDMIRFVRVVREYRTERDAAQEWINSYEGVIDGYTDAAEHYELCQQASEVGIILASVAMLLSNRRLWYISVLLGVVSVAGAGWT